MNEEIDKRVLHMYELHERRKLLSEKKVHDFLKQKGGYCKLKELKKVVSLDVISRLVLEGKIIRVVMRLNRNVGSYKRFMNLKIFKKRFYSYVWICLTRTDLVRLMFDALKKPKSRYTQKILTHFLRNYLTEAERIAVLWKLGVRKFRRSQVKSTIQIDETFFPRKISIKEVEE